MGAGMRYQPQGRSQVDPALGIKFLLNPALGVRDLMGSTTYDSTSGGGASKSGGRSGVARQYNAATDFFGEKVSQAPTAYSVMMVVDVPTMKDWTGLFARELYGTNSFKILQQESSGPEMRITEQGGNYVRADSGAATKLYGVGPVCVVVVWDGTSAYLHIGGKKYGDAAISSAPSNAASSRLKVFGISDSDNVTGKLFLCAYAPNVAWNREKARSLSANPWQIFDEADDNDLIAAASGVDGNATLTGIAATATVGSITAKGNATTTVTGIAASTAAGIIAAKGNAAALVTGAQAASSAGTISAAGGASTTLPGVQSAAQVGTITASGAATANANLTGVQATASAGTVTAAGTATATITGVQASGQPGTISASGAATATATITGVQATSQVGALSATGAASTALPGVQSAAQVGIVQATAGGNAITALPGIRATGAAGSISAIGSARADVTGVTATTAVGSFALSASAVAQVPTVVAAAQIGTLVAGGGASAFLLGVATSARVGTVSATGEMSPDATAYLQGVSAAATAGIISAYGSRSKIEVSVTEDDICAAVRKYIMSIAPQGMRVVRTPVNKASMPKGAYVSFTPGLRRDVSTNRDNYSDNGRFVSRSEMMAFQINCYGVGSADLAETLNVLFRDQYGIEQFTANVVPLYASATQQAPFVNDADQYEDCYIFEIELQINSQIVVPQASCNMLEIEIISVDATFPPQEVN